MKTTEIACKVGGILFMFAAAVFFEFWLVELLAKVGLQLVAALFFVGFDEYVVGMVFADLRDDAE